MEQQQFSLSISHYTINSVLTWLMMIYPPPTPGLSSAALRRKSDCAHFFYLLFVCYSMEYLIIWRWRFPNHVNYQPQDTSLVTQPMLQLRPNWSELRSMDYYHQIFCRFQKCKRKVPPPSPLSNDFEKSWFFSKILVMFFFFR